MFTYSISIAVLLLTIILTVKKESKLRQPINLAMVCVIGAFLMSSMVAFVSYDKLETETVKTRDMTMYYFKINPDSTIIVRDTVRSVVDGTENLKIKSKKYTSLAKLSKKDRSNAAIDVKYDNRAFLFDKNGNLQVKHDYGDGTSVHTFTENDVVVVGNYSKPMFYDYETNYIGNNWVSGISLPSKVDFYVLHIPKHMKIKASLINKYIKTENYENYLAQNNL